MSVKVEVLCMLDSRMSVTVVRYHCDINELMICFVKLKTVSAEVLLH